MDQNFTSMIHQQCMVDGRLVGEPEAVALNPATGATIARGPNFGAVETKAVIEAALLAIPDMRAAGEEAVGPVAPLFRIKDEDEAIRFAKKLEFGMPA